MGTRHLVIGWDGADLDVIESLGPATLPHLHRAMARGAHARLESVQPPATLPNWTTFLTGVDPGRHGVFDFTLRVGEGIRFTGGTIREAPTWAARMDAQGLACAVVGFPGTFPPEPLRHGVFVSGWDSPVAFRGDRSFVWPPRLHEVLVDRFGPQTFDDVDEFEADPDGRWHARLPAALVARVEKKAALGRWLLALRRWDVVALYFGESDTAAHHLWSLHDPKSPRHRSDAAPEAKAGLGTVYRALDAALGELLGAAGGEDQVDLTLLSDHGSGGSSDEVVYLNRALAEAGWLRFRGAGGAVDHLPAGTGLARTIFQTGKDLALTRLSPGLRERLFRLGGGVLPSWLESRTRFGAIDFPRTAAFSDELNYFPAVHLNVRGREPRGVVAPGDRKRIAGQVAEDLKGLRHPVTGAPLVREAWPREALFEGPFLGRAPDLLLDLHRTPAGYTYNLMPSGTAPQGLRGFVHRLPPADHLGRKGRSLPGSHRPRGILVLSGPTVLPTGAIEARIADATATLWSRLGVPVPAEAAGIPCFDCLDLDVLDGAEPPLAPSRPLPPPRPRGRTPGVAAVERRLRALGYL
jgi:predicted AlkP superfamily phosphohydrolase/phosphomutase